MTNTADLIAQAARNIVDAVATQTKAEAFTSKVVENVINDFIIDVLPQMADMDPEERVRCEMPTDLHNMAAVIVYRTKRLNEERDDKDQIPLKKCFDLLNSTFKRAVSKVSDGELSASVTRKMGTKKDNTEGELVEFGCNLWRVAPEEELPEELLQMAREMVALGYDRKQVSKAIATAYTEAK